MHPNIPEAESLLANLAKHPAGFLWHFLKDKGVDEGLIQSLIDEYCDPSYVHEIDNCVWDPEQKSILTPEEAEEDTRGEQLVEQSWFGDIVRQYEEQAHHNNKKSRNYANAAKLYNIDEDKSVKTIHERNDGVENMEELDDDSVEKINKPTTANTTYTETSSEDAALTAAREQGGSQVDLAGKEASANMRSGHTPRSVGIRFSDNDSDQDREELDTSSGSAASVAVHHESSGADWGG